MVPNKVTGPPKSGDVRKRGKVDGVEYETTPAQAAANRIRPWKTGKYARFVDATDYNRAKLQKVGDDYPEVFESFLDAVTDGEGDGVRAMAAMALTDTEVLVRRAAAKNIAEAGDVEMEEAVYDKFGDVIGHKTVTRPAVGTLLAANEQLGFTAKDWQINPKSAGEGKRDSAAAALMAREAALRQSGKPLDIPAWDPNS